MNASEEGNSFADYDLQIMNERMYQLIDYLTAQSWIQNLQRRIMEQNSQEGKIRADTSTEY